MRLVTFEKVLKNLLKFHEFGPVSFRKGATVISQNTVKMIFFRCSIHSTLKAHIFNTVGRKNLWLV